MTDPVKSWIDEHRAIHAPATEGWKYDAADDGVNFWAGDCRSDFHLSVADSAFCVESHTTFPAALKALEKVLEVLVAGAQGGNDAETIRNVAICAFQRS